jgi:hypothetical protein
LPASLIPVIIAYILAVAVTLAIAVAVAITIAVAVAVAAALIAFACPPLLSPLAALVIAFLPPATLVTVTMPSLLPLPSFAAHHPCCRCH